MTASPVRAGVTAAALVATSLVLAAAPAASTPSTRSPVRVMTAAAARPGVAPHDAPGGTYLDEKKHVLSMKGRNAGATGSHVTPKGGCTPVSGRDNPHYTAPDVSGHGWWGKGTCTADTATVYNCLYEYYTDGTWRRKVCSPKAKTLKPGTGGSAQRTNARVRCNSTGETISWRNHVDVDVNGQSDTAEQPYRQAEVNCVVN